MDTYEKKYKDALEWMREMYPCLTDSLREDADYYFPELKDSEDKVAIEFLKGQAIEMIASIEHDISQSVYDGEKGHSPEDERELARWKSALAWLEKQKEQKPVEYLPKEKVYDIMRNLTALSYSERIPINSDEYGWIHKITEAVRGLLDYPIEQKPVEWSEEDERIRKELVALFIEVRNSEGNEGYWHDLKVADILAYLEKRKEQKYIGLSETDKFFLQTVAVVLDDNEYKDAAKRLRDLSESLYLQPKAG